VYRCCDIRVKSKLSRPRSAGLAGSGRTASYPSKPRVESIFHELWQTIVKPGLRRRHIRMNNDDNYGEFRTSNHKLFELHQQSGTKPRLVLQHRMHRTSLVHPSWDSINMVAAGSLQHSQERTEIQQAQRANISEKLGAGGGT
jgi:hypothetical protein